MPLLIVMIRTEFGCIMEIFLSNGGITCQGGRMVKVDKGDWDKSRGVEENHNFNTEWLKRCQKALKPKPRGKRRAAIGGMHLQAIETEAPA
jgi:hypothetical protein